MSNYLPVPEPGHACRAGTSCLAGLAGVPVRPGRGSCLAWPGFLPGLEGDPR
ncbi:MAG TPA: hypothetical protein VNF47_00935 [Streptosporangiaceae bacterium]|nr:hypothetical protein [Streptosporangiaceae bacterium]